MGSSPWGLKELDMTERLNNENNNGGVRGVLSFLLLSTRDRRLGFTLGQQEEKAAALCVAVRPAFLLSRLFACCV